MTFTTTESQTASLVSSVSGCDSLATLNVTVNPTLLSTTDTTVCDTELPFDWNGLTFAAAGSQTATLSGVVTGCDSLATLNVTVNPTLLSTTDTTVCDTELPFDWNGLTFTAAGSQTATLSGVVTGCDSLATLNVTVNPTLLSTTDTTVCDTELPFDWNGLTFTAAGSQTSTLTSAVTGCDSLATLNVTVNPTLLSTTDITICDTQLPFDWNGLTFLAAGSQTATLTSAVTGCDSLATLNLSVNSTLLSTTDTTVCDTEVPFDWNGLTFTTTESQTTTLSSVVTGCDSIVTLNLTVNPTLLSTTDTTVCDTELPFDWNGLTFTAAGSQTATLSGVVTGCDSLATLNVIVNPTPDIFFTLSASEICSGDAVDISFNSSFPGTIFSWDVSQTPGVSGGIPGSGNQIDQVIDAVVSGSISYIVTPVLNSPPTTCIGTPVTVTVIVNPIPTIDIAPPTQTIYAGQSATITSTGDAPGGTYFWTQTSEITSNITVSPPITTTYDVSYTLNGCSVDTSAIVIVEAQPTLNSNSEVICSGDCVWLTATPSEPGGDYLWSTGETTQMIEVCPTTNTVYTVTYTINGFTTPASISTVTVNPTPLVEVNDETICDGNVANLTATPSIGGGTYLWNPGGETSQAISVSPSATTTYNVLYNLNGCEASGTGEVTINPVPNVVIGDETICEGESVTLTATPDIIGGDFIWSNNITSPSISVSPTVNSTYSVLYSINGCQNTASANVNVNVIPTLSFINDTICEGESGTINTIPSPSGGTFVWEDFSTLDSYTDSPIITTDYEVVYTLNSCSSLPQYGTIVVNPVPVVSLSDVLICEGESTTLNADVSLAGGNYLWNDGSTLPSLTISPLVSTTYDVEYNLDGCIGTSSALVSVQSPEPLDITISDTAGCAPLTVSFSNPLATAGSDCIWNINNGDEVSGCTATYTFENGGCYDLSLTVNDGVCVSNAIEYNIICLDDPPIASFVVVPPILTENSQWVQMNNNSIGAVDYLWNFGDGDTSTLINPQHLYVDVESGINIGLIAYSIQGCSDTAQLLLDYQDEPIIYIPNTFTPDGDQHNHVFLPVFTSGYDPYNYNLMIFDRWGEVIFESRDATVGWDGSYSGDARNVQDGVYTYKIVYKVKKTDERRLIVGHVTLIR